MAGGRLLDDPLPQLGEQGAIGHAIGEQVVFHALVGIVPERGIGLVHRGAHRSHNPSQVSVTGFPSSKSRSRNSTALVSDGASPPKARRHEPSTSLRKTCRFRTVTPAGMARSALMAALAGTVRRLAESKSTTKRERFGWFLSTCTVWRVAFT